MQVVLFAVLIVLVLGYWAARFWRWLSCQWFLIVLAKFLSGWHPADRPGRGLRAARRWAVVAVTVGLVTGGLADAQVTALVFLGLLAAAFCLACWWLVRWGRQYKIRRVYLKPLHKRLALRVGHDERRPVRAWIKDAIPGQKVRLELPAGSAPSAAEEKEIERIAAFALAIQNPEASWHRAGPKPAVTVTATEPSPPDVRLSTVASTGRTVRQEIERAPSDVVVWGLGRGGVPVTTSLSGDSPHGGMSMASGSGKSISARAYLAEMLFKGCLGIVLDYKMISHQWAKGLPNVVIYRRPHEIHQALVWLDAEAQRRNEVALAGADLDGNVHAVVGDRIVVICEELNATMSKLRAYWRGLRNEDKSLPQRSPALEALDAVNLMGRQVLLNLMYMGQRLSVKAIGGDGDARESIGVVAFGRYSASNWKMLAPDFPMPPPSRKPGRIQVVTDQVRECQGVFMSAAEARELALAGTVAAPPAGMPYARAVATETHPQLSGADMRFVPETMPPVPVLPPAVTLSEAVSEGIVSCSLAAVRRASTRDPEFPGGAGVRGLAKLYDSTELALWDAGRR